VNVFSLFSGIGGLELGLERAGMTTVAQVEIDLYCRRVLARHWPEVPRHDHVRTCVDWWLGGDPRPTVDLVCGGFPCQPVSTAGQRLAQADPRWLWPAFHTVVRALRPRYVLVENVPGLLAAGMGDILGDLAGIGYDAEWDRVPAAFVGAPHIRGRIFVVAYPDGGTVQSRRRGRRTAQTGAAADVADTSSGRHWPSPRVLRTGRHGPINGGGWAVEPDMARVAHGIPHGMDRRRALGNAVVPQVAEHVGRLILAADREQAA
jgi:DNA (cytosine-5)-methyltransferase 1